MVRFKNRYLTFEIEPVKISEYKPWFLKASKLYGAILKTLSTLHGDFGVAATISGLSVKYLNKETKICVIRCRHGPHKLISSVLPFIKTIDDKPVQVNTLYMGASLHHCYEFIKSYQLNHLRKFKSIFCDNVIFIEYERSVVDFKDELDNLKRKTQILHESSYVTPPK